MNIPTPSVTNGDWLRALLSAPAQLFDVTHGFLAEAVEQEPRVMVGGQNLRSLGVNSAVAHPHFIDLVHQFADEVEPKARVAESRDPALRRENHLGVLDRILKIIFAPHGGEKVAQASGLPMRNRKQAVRVTSRSAVAPMPSSNASG